MMSKLCYDDKAVQGGSLYVRRGGAAIDSINIVSCSCRVGGTLNSCQMRSARPLACTLVTATGDALRAGSSCVADLGAPDGPTGDHPASRWQTQDSESACGLIVNPPCLECSAVGIKELMHRSMASCPALLPSCCSITFQVGVFT